MVSKRRPKRRSKHSVVRGDPERTKRLILEAALAEFAEKGLGGGRVEVIAEKAGVNRQALYYHYVNKDGLYRATVEFSYGIARSFDPKDELESAGSAEDRLRVLVSGFFENMRQNQSIVSLISEENRLRGRHVKKSSFATDINAPFVKRVESIYNDGVASGLFRPGIDPKQLWITIVSMSQFYFSNIYTMSHILSSDLGEDAMIAKRKKHIEEFLLWGLRARKDGN